MSKKKLAITIETPSTDRRIGRRPSNAFEVGNKHAFRPGQSGNRSGKPKDARRLISKSLRAQLPDRAPDEIASKLGLGRGASWAMCIARMLLYKAATGSVEAAREVRESVEGSRVNNSLQLLDEDGSPAKVPDLKIVFVSPQQSSQGHYLDRTTPALPLPPLNCRID